MMGETVAQEPLFYALSVERHVPEGHLLRSFSHCRIFESGRSAPILLASLVEIVQ